jgi:hypothetical protein
MSMEEVLAGSGRAVPGTDGLLHLLQLDPHVVDVRVDGDQVHVLFLVKLPIHQQHSFSDVSLRAFIRVVS